MSDAHITIEGLPELLRRIDSVADMKRVSHAMRGAALHIKGKIAWYPPESEANMPRTIAGTNRTLSWYQRGYGTRYIGGGGRKTSETLGRKWTIATRDRGLTQIIGNNVSYGPFVQGKRQAWFHKKRGWKTTDQVAKEETKHVVKFVKDEVEKILDGR